MPLLDPKPLIDVLGTMGEAVGLKVSEDKPEIIRYVNKYRNTLFNLYPEFELFNNVFHRICITDGYFTLPPDIAAVEAVWECGRPLTIHSRWRESHTGIGCGPNRAEVTEMAEMFPTERDFCGTTKLRVFTEREEDEGKCINLEVVVEGEMKKAVVKLISDGWAILDMPVSKILSVSLPPDRVGFVRLANEDGFVLSEYSPYETVPSYRRFKVNRCNKRTVVVQGVKRFLKIYDDLDIVEVGDDLVIEAAGKFFKFGENTADGNEIAVGDRWRNEMRVMLNGLIARHRGNAVQDGNPAQYYRPRKKTLPGYGRK